MWVRSRVDSLVDNWPEAGYFPPVSFKEPSLGPAGEEKVIRTNIDQNARLVDVLLGGKEVPDGRTVSDGKILVCAIDWLLFMFDNRNRRL